LNLSSKLLACGWYGLVSLSNMTITGNRFWLQICRNNDRLFVLNGQRLKLWNLKVQQR
jgi:hypothetical protein